MVLSAFVFITADVQRPATSAKGLMELTLEASLDRTSHRQWARYPPFLSEGADCRMAMLLCVVRQAHHEGSGLMAGSHNLQSEELPQGALGLVTIHAILNLPHGELVEPRTVPFAKI
jgi:hypothetical protein